MAKKDGVVVPKNWANRIVGYSEESPDQLLANPQNWRIHSKNQQIAMAGVLDDIGFIAPVIVNRSTGHLVDGHLRVSLALRHEIPMIPVVYVDITEQEEKEALATFDPITNMASSDMAMLEGLIKDLDSVNDTARLLLGEIVHEANKKAVKAILDPMNGYLGTQHTPDQMDSDSGTLPEGVLPRSAASVDMDDDDEDNNDDDYASDDDDEIADIFDFTKDKDELERNDFGQKIYPSMYTENEWGVPELSLALQMRKPPVLVERWGRIARHGTRMPGLWHFYTDDYKFTGVWKNPDSVVKSGAIAAIEPNFSTGQNYAKAEVLYNIWQKRWLASYWQTRGIEIVVDLNIEPIFADIALLGVPKGWRSYAVRMHDKEGYDINKVIEWERIAKEHAESDDILLMVFATTKKGEEICAERGWYYMKMDAHIKGTAL